MRRRGVGWEASGQWLAMSMRDNSLFLSLSPPGLCSPIASYGKPLVFDMMELDMFDTVKKQLERLETGLTQALLSKKILESER